MYDQDDKYYTTTLLGRNLHFWIKIAYRCLSILFFIGYIFIRNALGYPEAFVEFFSSEFFKTFLFILVITLGAIWALIVQLVGIKVGDTNPFDFNENPYSMNFKKLIKIDVILIISFELLVNLLYLF